MGRLGRPPVDPDVVTVAGIDPVTGVACAWSAGVFSGGGAAQARAAAAAGAEVEVAPGVMVVAGADDVTGACAAIIAAVGGRTILSGADPGFPIAGVPHPVRFRRTWTGGADV